MAAHQRMVAARTPGQLAARAQRAHILRNVHANRLAMRASNFGTHLSRTASMRPGGVGGASPVVANATRGWHVGDPINNLTAKGNVPSWDAVRQRYWKNQRFYRTATYGPTDLARMRKGLAPQRINDFGQLESVQLHHNPPRSAGGLFDVRPLWPDQHRLVHAIGG